MVKRVERSEVEQELKIKISPEDLEKVFQILLPEAERGSLDHKYLPRAYYDTADMNLYRNGVSLRVQYKMGGGGKIGGYEQTVKFEIEPQGHVAEGALLRKECKNLLPNHKPDFNAVRDRDAVAAVAPFKKSKLKHVFTAAIERRSFNLAEGRGKKRIVAEVAFDIGEIILPCSDRHYPFSEIEIEIKKGNPKGIAAIQDKVMRLAPSAVVQPLSKSDQGSLICLRQRRRRGP